MKFITFLMSSEFCSSSGITLLTTKGKSVLSLESGEKVT